ncbi:MAG: response regulator transcription factor [Oscillospiraceae bacterium]|nr:response regulator transcription factor [Oscillospiraceae bacterium]
MDTQTILVVDDEAEIREGLRILLSGENYTILEAENGSQALERLADNADNIDLVILDIMMPGLSGLRVCEEIRKKSTVPILFLTAKAQEEDKLVGLIAGGDDYLPKPFSYSELMGRVKALLRRYCVYRGKAQSGTLGRDNILSANGIKLSLDYNQIWVRGKQVELTEIEYRILRLLMQNSHRFFSAQSIYESVWNEPYFYISNGTVMVHIRKLRVKIEEDPQAPKILKTIWGKGYRFEVNADDE